jgi:putative copper resistance protein D
VECALIVCRALHFTASMGLFGFSGFAAAIAPPELAERLAPSLRRASAIAILLIAVTTIVWLLLEAGEAGDGWSDAINPRTISTLLLETQFGNVWRWRLALASILLFAPMLAPRDNWRLTALLCALLLASLGFVGHGAMLDGALGWLNRLSHALHMLAAGVWFGSLVALLAGLPLPGRLPPSADATIALRRFSALGSVAVAVVLVTGVVNTWLALGGAPFDIGSPYQALLLAKTLLVAAMIGLALANRYAFMPRLAVEPRALHRLRAAIVAEVALGLGAIALVSILGTLPPA